MFKAPFSFDGRIRRLEYGLSYLIGVILYYAVFLSAAFSSMYIMILIIPIFWFLFAQGAKRCHDRDNSGWFQLIPFYGLWMLFAPGDEGANRFGNNPKQAEDPSYKSKILDQN